MKKLLTILSALVSLLLLAAACGQKKLPEPSDVTFDVTISESSLDKVVAKVTPSDDNTMYFCNIFQASDPDSLFQAITEGIPEEEVEGHLYTGKRDISFTGEFAPETMYTVIAAEYSPESGKLTGNYGSATFISEKAPDPDPDPDPEPEPEESFTFRLVETTYNSATIEVTPSDLKMTYFIEVKEASFCDSMSDDELVAEIISLYGGPMASLFTYRGVTMATSGTDFGILQPDTEYYIMAFGYEIRTNSATTDLYKMKFRTDSSADPSLNSFNFSISGITEYGADVSVAPSEASVLYIWDVITSEKYNQYGGNAEAIEKYLSEYIDSQINETFPTREDVVAIIAVRGNSSHTYTTLLPETTYHVWAVCVDKSGNPLAAPQTSEGFTTEQAVISDATAEIVFGKYYDGDELYGTDPETYSSYQGKAYLTATISHSANAVTWYTIYTETNILDTEEYPDNKLRGILESQGTEGKTELRYAVPWDKEVYFLAIAKDAEGNFGPVFRTSITLQKDGCSDINDIL